MIHALLAFSSLKSLVPGLIRRLDHEVKTSAHIVTIFNIPSIILLTSEEALLRPSNY